MRILIAGVGAIGSNLARYLVPDLKGEHIIDVLDMDKVEERNITAGTQFYFRDQIGLSKVEALQYNIERAFERNVGMDEHKIVSGDEFLYDLVIDCLDNYDGRSVLQWQAAKNGTACLHIGFSDDYTFAIEWNENYQVPTNITGLDIFELPGAAAFVNSVASLGALVAEEYIREGKRLEIVGGKFTHSLIS